MERTEGFEDWLTQIEEQVKWEKEIECIDGIRNYDHEMRHLNFISEVDMKFQVMYDKVQDMALGAEVSK